ncbi:MAG: pknB 22 [Planctomycetaceae bacterium]|nr:pknB 22 [Planctomycetaceae bacterium]
MRAKTTLSMAVGIILVCCQIAIAEESTAIETIFRNHAEALAKADLIRSRAANKARDDAVSMLTKLAAKSYKANDRLAETEAWKAVLKLQRNHKKATQYFTDLGTLDKVLAEISDGIPQAPAVNEEPDKKAPAKKFAVSQPAFQKWLQEASNLPPQLQVEAVSKKLVELNPGFDGKLKPQIGSGVVIAITLSNEKVADLSPLRVFSKMTALTCDGNAGGVSALQDLSPLRDMRLYVLNCRGSRISDLTPLKGMPLEYLTCDFSPVADLTPLKGLPLQHLGLNSTKVSDLGPLKGLKLNSLHVNLTEVADLAPLKGMPLRNLSCDETLVSDLTPLAGMELNTVALLNAPVSDITPLKGMPISRLNLSGSKVSDLAPIKGMPLIFFYCQNTGVTESSPLEGMQLKHLWWDFKQPDDLRIARAMKSLELINNIPVAEFFQKQAAK